MGYPTATHNKHRTDRAKT